VISSDRAEAHLLTGMEAENGVSIAKVKNLDLSCKANVKAKIKSHQSISPPVTSLDQ
jgi:hypothetical protein